MQDTIGLSGIPKDHKEEVVYIQWVLTCVQLPFLSFLIHRL